MDYFIVNVTPHDYETIAIYNCYEEADNDLDHYCNVYPNGYIDILSEDELIQAKENKWITKLDSLMRIQFLKNLL